ncbi:MAG: hypothetical protein ACOH5I_26615 [Oligoflexus sp.]
MSDTRKYDEFIIKNYEDAMKSLAEMLRFLKVNAALLSKEQQQEIICNIEQLSNTINRMRYGDSK